MFLPIHLLFQLNNYSFRKNCLTLSEMESPHRAFQRNPSISCTITLWHLDTSEGVLGLPHLGPGAGHNLYSGVQQTWGFPGAGGWGKPQTADSHLSRYRWRKLIQVKKSTRAHTWPVHFRGCSDSSLLAGPPFTEDMKPSVNSSYPNSKVTLS